MGMSTYLAGFLAHWYFRNDADTASPPATIYASLLDSNAAELTSRVAVAFAAHSGGIIAATADVTFTCTTAGTATHAQLWDAAAAGNGLFPQALRKLQTLEVGQTLTVPAAQFRVNLAA